MFKGKPTRVIITGDAKKEFNKLNKIMLEIRDKFSEIIKFLINNYKTIMCEESFKYSYLIIISYYFYKVY